MIVCAPHGVRYARMLSAGISSRYYFDGMVSLFIAQMLDLHTAGCAFGQHIFGWAVFECLFQTLGDLRGKVVVFLLHSERSGQAAAAGLEVGDFDAAKLLQKLDARRSITDSLQVARRMINILIRIFSPQVYLGVLQLVLIVKVKQIIHQLVRVFRHKFRILTRYKMPQLLLEDQCGAWLGTDDLVSIADGLDQVLDIVCQIFSRFIGIAIDHCRQRCG